MKYIYIYKRLYKLFDCAKEVLKTKAKAIMINVIIITKTENRNKIAAELIISTSIQIYL
jgi:hypothetical protein